MGNEVKLVTGMNLSCVNWEVEGIWRMLRNTVVQGANPQELIIYGGTGKAARNWECYWAIERVLKQLKPDETLLVQSGKPVGVFKTHTGAPRVLISNSMLVPKWCTPENFRELEMLGLMMYGQMTAGSWAFIGQQGIMQGTYETFIAAGAGKGKFIFTAGLGNMGGAQAQAGKMAGAATLIVEIDPSKIERCKKEGWIDCAYSDIEKAVRRALKAKDEGEAIAIALQANVVDVLDWLVRQNITPDIVTDQTSAHDPLNGYFPVGVSFEDALKMRKEKEGEYIKASKRTMRIHVEHLLTLQSRGATVFEYGNGIRLQAQEQGLENAFDIKGFVFRYIRPLFCQGRGPFRVVALSGDPADITVVDQIILDLFADNKLLCNWIHKAQEFIDFGKQPGLPARVCWLGMGERARAVKAIWEAIRAGRIKTFIWIGRDHLDCGSVSSPSRETESMLDGSDAVADWPILNALLNASCGATWVSVHQGGGVGIGNSIHAGQCFVLTPSIESLERAMLVFTNDPAIGVARHVDAGYEEAMETAEQHGIIIPMRN